MTARRSPGREHALRRLGVPADGSIARLLDEADFTIVDIGAREGVRPEMRVLAPFGSLVACEPEAEEAKRLQAQLAEELPWRNVIVLPVAIADTTGTATLHVSTRPGMSSLLPPNPDVVARYYKSTAFTVGTTQEVPTMRLDEAAAEYGFSDASLLKVDTQGTELAILESGSQLLQDAVEAVYLESLFHEFYRGQSLFADTDAFLRGFGFILVDMRVMTMRGRGYARDIVSRRQPVWAHCLYLRDPEIVRARGSRSQARWLGIALAYQHHDLAYEIAREPALAAAFGDSLGDDLHAALQARTQSRLAGLTDEERASELAAHRRVH